MLSRFPPLKDILVGSDVGPLDDGTDRMADGERFW